MKMKVSLLLCLTLLIQIELHSCFVDIGYLGYGAIAAGSAYFYKNRCSYVQCCEFKNPSNMFNNLDANLRHKVFGQPLLHKNLAAAIHAHANKANPSNPLVISLHGWTGSGKTYTCQIVAQTMFENGLDSIYVKKITPALLFPNSNDVNHYKSKLVRFLEDQAYLCKKSLIIIEEIDKMHPELIDTLSSFINNFGPSINQMTFIFTSNVGSNKIVEKTFEFYEEGKPRESFELADFEKLVKNQVYNDESTMKYSSLISSHLINHYIPFLPLERSHVEQCVVVAFEGTQYYRHVPSSHLAKVKDYVFKSLEWWPADLQLYSNSGCKQVANKVDVATRLLT